MKSLTLTVGGDVSSDRAMWNLLLKACHQSGATVVNTASHPFYPMGFSGVAILAESHATIHTWPEKFRAVIDYFSCSKDPKFDVFVGVFVDAGLSVLDKNIEDRKLISDRI